MENLLNQLIGQLKYIPRSILIAILFALAFLYIKEHGRETIKGLKDLFNNGWLVAFILYVAYMFTSTILVRYNNNPLIAVFTHLWFEHGEVGYNNEIIKNILFFIPFTFLMLQAFRPKRPVVSSIIVSTCTTFIIETCQLLFWIGQFQFADLVDNFLGGMIGCGIWHMTDKKIVQRAIRWTYDRFKANKG